MSQNPFLVPSTFPESPAPCTERMPSVIPPVAASSAAGVVVPTAAASTDNMVMGLDDATHEDAAPSRADLLQRAALLGPSRMTWENIVLQPTDPILKDKMQPRVAERRARFRRVVKVALGVCAAFCVVATAATAVSSVRNPSSASSTASKSAPALGSTPIEKLEQTNLTKAPARPVTAAVTRPAKLAKRR